MSVLVFIDQADGQVKKASFEAMSYGSKVAELLQTTAEGIVLGTINEDLAGLGKYGLKKIHHVNNDVLNHFDAQVFTNVIAQAVESTGAKVVIFSNNIDGKAIAPRLAARLKAGLVAGAISVPETSNGFTVTKNVFSGKAFAKVSLNSDIKIISLNTNAFPVTMVEGTAEVVALNASVDQPKVKVT